MGGGGGCNRGGYRVSKKRGPNGRHTPLMKVATFAVPDQFFVMAFLGLSSSAKLVF